MKSKGKIQNTKKSKTSAEYIIKNKEKLLQKRKKTKRLKRRIMILILLLIVLCTLGIKLPYFNISSFKISGNKNLSYEYVESIYSQFKGQNIFIFNQKLFNEKIKQNKYVENATIKRVLPNSIKISIIEREADFYIQGKDAYFTMDSNGNILEKNSKLVNKELVQILGFNENMIKDNKLALDDRQKQVLNEFHELSKKNNSNVKFDGINFYDVTDISIIVKKLTIKIGMQYDMKAKLNKAINVISAHNTIDKEGYVDVSFNGNPVVNVK